VASDAADHPGSGGNGQEVVGPVPGRLGGVYGGSAGTGGIAGVGMSGSTGVCGGAGVGVLKTGIAPKMAASRFATWKVSSGTRQTLS
jgi:hypothetical protein